MYGSLKIVPKRDRAGARDTYKLTSEQLQFYEDKGYLLIEKLIDSALLQSYRERFIQICNRLIGNTLVSVVKDQTLFDKNLKPEDYINKVQELLYDEVYMTYSEHPDILDIASQIIGDDITAVNSMLINKPPGTTRHLPHQDIYYFPFRPADKIVATWTAIDYVDSQNGCLYVLPGSHKAQTLYEHGDQKEEKKQFFHGIFEEEKYAPMNERIDLIMNPGDTVFFHPYLVHGSRANVSKNYRKAITCHYANSSCYFVDISGTTQQNLASQMEAEMRKRGADLSFADMWRVKSRHLRGIRSNL